MSIITNTNTSSKTSLLGLLLLLFLLYISHPVMEFQAPILGPQPQLISLCKSPLSLKLSFQQIFCSSHSSQAIMKFTLINSGYSHDLLFVFPFLFFLWFDVHQSELCIVCWNYYMLGLVDYHLIISGIFSFFMCCRSLDSLRTSGFTKYCVYHIPLFSGFFLPFYSLCYKSWISFFRKFIYTLFFFGLQEYQWIQRKL